MNREIKFRAWDGKKMLLNVGVHPHLCSDLSHDDEYYKDNQDGRWIIGLGFDSYKVMQYTGLKDKNGKEIYEGDILEFDPEDDEPNLPHYVQVIWEEEDAKFYCEEVNGNRYSGYMSEFEDCNIIGNIYENPELLK